uniref:Cytochrome c oxidase subunit 8 n=1 Tax=Mus spicilegus TaxID=10103 RepID=A0A8C6GEW0_MUSSI
MSVLRPLLLRSLTGSAHRLMMPAAQVHSKRPQEQLKVLDINIGLTYCFMCCLLPTGWIRYTWRATRSRSEESCLPSSFD